EEAGRVRVAAGAIAREGQHRRFAGEDLKAGQVVFGAGQLVHPAELGMMASLGVGEVRVYRKLRVAFFSTGDELRSVGTPLAAGEVYDSNRYTIYGMLTRLNCDVLDMGVVPDAPEARERRSGLGHPVVDVAGELLHRAAGGRRQLRCWRPRRRSVARGIDLSYSR